MADVLTTCKPMNKTDAATVWQHFGNLKGIAQASQDELALCPGLGKVKTQRLYAALHKPFSKRATRERQKKKEEEEEAEKARMEKQNQAAKGNNDENENGSGAGRGEILIS
jgi:DNA excision repair protein ERCC-1